jgi:hypothetical protein
MPLTDRAIQNEKPRMKTFKLYDSGGLYLEVAPSGGKWWRLKYRFRSKEKRLSLGVYTAAGSKTVEVGLKDARDSRDKERKLLAEGKDPAVNRKEQESARASCAANTFEEVAGEWFAKFFATLAPAHVERKIS